MKNEAQIAQFEKTVQNLKEVLEKLPSAGSDYAIFRDSAIYRFKMVFDICWKTLKEKLREEYGIDEASPKKVFQEAFKHGLSENDSALISMTDLRNETTHAYNEEFAEKVLAELPRILAAFEELVCKLKKVRTCKFRVY